MARVYLVRDLKHARDVALKVIRPELAASLGGERFLREIGIAARLRHPNIVPLYDSGDAAGVLYFVMPYEEGPSLRDRLVAGPLSRAEALSVLRDVARALAYAHEHGVVHRDIKPDNVLLSGGAAVVTDFGIAKAFGAAQSDPAGSTLTNAGWGIGTPAYMAPEQAVGDPGTDARADIYSFGCLAYELFTGKPPFGDRPSHQLIAAQLGEPPVPLAEAAADLATPVAAILSQCLEKSPEARPQSARDILRVLEQTPETGPVPRRRSPRLARRVLLALGAAAIVLAGGAYWFRRPPPLPSPMPVAVLPLRSLGGDSLLGEAVSEQVAIGLGRMPWLLIKSRLGVRNYRGREVIDPVETGRALGADFLVTGSLREADGRLTVNVQLSAVEDGRQLWAERFDRAGTDLESLADSISGRVGDTLRVLFAPRTTAPRVVRGRQSNPEAYRLYVLGQRQLDRRGQSVRASADNFRRAIGLDSMYAEPYAGLSLALALYPYFQGVPAPDVYEEVRLMAAQAIRLDSTLAQPHIALGLAYQHARQWDRALEEFTTAVRLNPHDVEARVQLGRYFLAHGRLREGLAQVRRAREDDPASALVSSWVAYAFYLGGQLDSALAEGRRALQSDSTNLTTVAYTALFLLKSGRVAEARDLAHRVPNYPLSYYVLASAGERVAVMDRLRLLEQVRPAPSLVETNQALAWLGFGDTLRALDALERATATMEIWPSMHGGVRDPVFDPIRGSPRFGAIVASLGLLPGEAKAEGLR
jgi:serine/threonine-protein kinase